MQITEIMQPTEGPPDKPLLVNPVSVMLGVPTYFLSPEGPVPDTQGIVCGRLLADTVFAALTHIARREHAALVHLGVYNPRYARRPDGAIIQPIRWSNHAFGEAMDFVGIITDWGQGDFLAIPALQAHHSALLDEIIVACRQAITAAGRRAEIVDEGGWYHIGIWPE